MDEKSAEMAWLRKERVSLQRDYPGKWLAIEGERLVAVGDELEEVRAAASALGIDDPLFTATRQKSLERVRLIRHLSS